MTKPLILASLLLGSFAHAAPTPPAPPAPPTPTTGPTGCKQTGAMLFTSDVRPMPHQQVATTHVKLYATGAWTFAELRADGTRGREASGCLPAAKLAIVVSDLDKATWTITIPEVTCAAIGQTFTEYTRRGKLVWTDAICSGPMLDDDSHKKLDEVIAILAEAAKPSAIETSRGKPVQ